jgi:hypothetical protein
MHDLPELIKNGQHRLSGNSTTDAAFQFLRDNHRKGLDANDVTLIQECHCSAKRADGSG